MCISIKTEYANNLGRPSRDSFEAFQVRVRLVLSNMNICLADNFTDCANYSRGIKRVGKSGLSIPLGLLQICS
jgi:hypothetical protein